MYIDSNIFIFEALDTTELGDNCRRVIARIQNGDINCASSYLTIDEVICVLKKKAGRDAAVRIAKASLSLPVRWMDVDREIVVRMIEHFSDHEMDPRDSLHLASMRSAGITAILSEDSYFDNVMGINRTDSEAFLRSMKASK